MRGDLLFDFAPGAHFEAAANPAKRLARKGGGFGSADGTLDRLLQPVRRNGALGLLQNLGRDNRLRLGWCLPSHALRLAFTMAETAAP